MFGDGEEVVPGQINTVVSIPKKKPKRCLPNTFVDIHNDIVALLVEVSDTGTVSNCIL